MTAEARIEHDRARPDGYFGPDSVAWRVLTAPATTLMIAQLTNLLEVPHRDFQAVLLGHDPLFPTNPRRQRGWRLPTAKGGHFHDRLRRTVGVADGVQQVGELTQNACAGAIELLLQGVQLGCC